MRFSPRNLRRHDTDPGTNTTDVVLIGGGIMSATLGALLATLQPDWSVVVLEQADHVAGESSAAWNNAGTGHSGYCELNYMPDPDDGTRAIAAAEQFALTRQWWSHLVATGVLPDSEQFLHRVPHMDLVFGDADVDYLRRRHATLVRSPLFAAMEYSEDPAEIASWAPLLMDGREPGEPIAATRHQGGTDVDFGALTRLLLDVVSERGGEIKTGHEVTRLRRADGLWTVSGKDRRSRQRFSTRARFVFVGAGGNALRLLQQARVPEVRGYGVLPAGAAFLRCDRPEVVARHDAKVYGQAEIGAPPMSVPHLDKRMVEGTGSLLFGPYATFTTRLLKHGAFTDLLKTLRPGNLHILAAACAGNGPLLKYLISQVLASDRKRFAALQKFYPGARPQDWTLIRAGQRAQLVTPGSPGIGVLRMGTELVVGADGTAAGLLGASPGASTALPIMLDLLERCFPAQWRRWEGQLATGIPALADHDRTVAG